MAVKLKKSSVLGTLSLTPLIDVVFLLLIFFLVATRFEEEERQMDIVLPQASEAMPLVSEPSEMFVNIDESGRYFVNGHELNVAQLAAGLRQAAANNPASQTVIIRGDRRCDFHYVVTVMDLCNQARIRDYRVTTAKPSG